MASQLGRDGLMKRVLRKIVWVQIGLLWAFLSGCYSDIYGVAPLTRQELASMDLKVSVALVKNQAGSPRLLIRESFNMPRSGALALKLPDTFLRKDKLYNRIEDLSVTHGAILRPHETEPSVKFLEFPKGKRLEIKYLFRPNDPSEPQGSESFSAPIIRDDYFQFVGLMAFIYPMALLGSKPFQLTLEWSVPQDFSVFNSFGGNQARQIIVTDFDKLRDAFFVAGRNMRLREARVRNQPVYITFNGHWDYISDDEFINVVTSLLAEQRKTFADDNFPYFLINLLSVPQACSGEVKFAGTAHPNSFRAFFPSGCRFLPEMKQLISHELMHMWIGKIIKVGHERGHIDGKWFTEGWTDFFGRILAYRAGTISEAEYFQSLNRQLEKYFISSERLVTLHGLVSRMYRNGYSSRALEDLPYQQGEIMAWRINQRIKDRWGNRFSLEDVIRDMLKIARAHGGSKNFNFTEIRDVVNRYVPGALDEELAKIYNGRLLLPPELRNCRKRVRSSITRFFRLPRNISTDIIFYGPAQYSCDHWLK